MLNLLSTTEPGEVLLSDTFDEYLMRLGYEQVSGKHFDFNNVCRGGQFGNAQFLIGQLEASMRRFAHYTVNVTDGQVITRQTGIFRTNCMDWQVCRPDVNVRSSLSNERYCAGWTVWIAPM